MDSPLFLADRLTGHELSLTRPRSRGGTRSCPTGEGRGEGWFMGSGLFPLDLLIGHEPRWSAGLRPGALTVESNAPGRRPALRFTGRARLPPRWPRASTGAGPSPRDSVREPPSQG